MIATNAKIWSMCSARSFFLIPTQVSGILRSMYKVMQLTRLQRRIVDVFRQRAGAALPPPTYRELCQKFGWQSTGTARDHLKALLYKGVLAPGSGKARGTHLKRNSMAEATLLPLVGRIVAGRPVAAEEHIDDEIAVPSFLAPDRDGFLLRVSGDSMEGAGIIEGDLVVVRKEENPRQGDIVAATVSGETTLKRLEKHGGAWVLVPENPKYSIIELDTEEVKVHGVVTGILRSLRGSSSSSGRRVPHSTGEGN